MPRRPHDIAGKQYNYLTALRFSRATPRGGGGTDTLWIFRCVCGKEKELIASTVVRGRTKSCGCMKAFLISTSNAFPDNRAIYNRAFGVHVRGAKRRNITNYLTQNEYISIIKNPCVYCGQFSQRARKKGGATVSANSADRLNNEPYYKLENTVPACFMCQKMKQSYSFNDYVRKCAEITAYMAKDPQQVVLK